MKISRKPATIRPRFGFVIPSDRELPDVFIPHEGLQDAMHGDQVLVRLVERAAVVGRKAEGQIVKILQRANTHIVGTFTIRRGIAVVQPSDVKSPPKSSFRKSSHCRQIRGSGHRRNHPVAATWTNRRKEESRKPLAAKAIQVWTF